MELLNLSIRELNNLFVNKKVKPSELYSETFDRAASSEAALHAHLSLFEETNLEKAKNSDERFSNSLFLLTSFKDFLFLCLIISPNLIIFLNSNGRYMKK